jgi:hypothetical protein
MVPAAPRGLVAADEPPPIEAAWAGWQALFFSRTAPDGGWAYDPASHYWAAMEVEGDHGIRPAVAWTGQHLYVWSDAGLLRWTPAARG